MFTFAFGTFVGAFIGWAIPQPLWAKALQAKVLEWLRP